MATLDPNTQVGTLVAERPSRSRVFERWGVDYCCGGKRPLREACEQKGLDLTAVLRELEADSRRLEAPETDWTRASLTELADHIENTHHAYLREALPRLTTLTQKVAAAHGDRRPELRKVAAVFEGMREELEAHMNKEELILFPLCRKLDLADRLPAFHCGSIANPVRVMEMEHEDAGNALETMRSLTDGFTPPPDACNTYRAMLDGLAELESDLHIHVHKENNILFPRAIEREAELAA